MAGSRDTTQTVAAAGRGERRPAFASGSALATEVREQVEAHLRACGKLPRAYVSFYAKAIFAVSLTLGSWAVLMLASPGPPLALSCLCGIAAGTLLTGFCIQHDANHGAAFAHRRYNRLLGLSSDALMGFSSHAWRVKHNVTHHTYTNVDTYDIDISQPPLIRLAPAQEPRWWYRLQHVYVWPLYTLMAFRLQLFGDPLAYARGNVAQSRLRLPRGWELTGMLAGRAVFLGWAVVCPLLVYPWQTAAIGYGCVVGAMSVGMVTIFQLAHCVEEATYLGPADLAAETRDWTAHQIETTVDFCPRNPFLTWALGGLNYQIEHHLFPRLPHTIYPEIAGIVRSCAERHGVRYTCQPSFAAAFGSHWRHLRAMGRLGRPPEIDMG